MQFVRDIPKEKHGFDIPDIADFPDVAKEERYKDNPEMDNLVNQLETAFNNNKPVNDLRDMFDRIIEFSQKQMPMWNGEEKYIKGYKKNAFKIYKFYQEHADDQLVNTNLNKNSEAVYNRIKNDGVAFYTLGPDVIKQLQDILVPEIEKLLKKPDWIPPIGTYDRSLPGHNTHIDFAVRNILDREFASRGILSACDHYWQRRGASVRKWTLHVSKPTDQHLFQYYQDCETTPVTTNLHIDPKDGLFKALLYLFPVEEPNGPIWFVRESHRWQRNEFEMLMARGIATGDYLENPTARRAVFRLPTRLRKSLQFGRNLLDGTPEQQKILDKKAPMVNPHNLAIFDPGNIMHTGGWVKEGFRANLQIQIRFLNFG